MRSAIDAFYQIQKVSVKKDKEKIVLENSRNSTFMTMVDLLFNDMITTGIAIKKFEKDTNESEAELFSDVKRLIDYVKENNTGSGRVVESIKMSIGLLPLEDQQFMKQLFTKTFKCGATLKTINKALGYEFIPEFSCQLAHPYEKHVGKLKGKSFTLTRKLDGYRLQCLVDIKDFSIKFFSRKGKPILWMGELENEVWGFVVENELDKDEYFVENGIYLDGEAVLIDPTGEMSETELFQATSKVMRADGEKLNIKFSLFDYMSSKEFLKDKMSILPYSKRRENLESLSYDGLKLVDLVEKVYQGIDIAEVDRLMEEVSKPNGWEGLMLNIDDAKYQCKRTANLLKIKQFYYADIPVVDIYEGDKGKKYEDMMGGAVCQFKDFTIDIGSGWTDEQRKEYWNEPSRLIGQMIEIQYQGETINEKGGSGLRFPTLQRLRPDKTVDDISYET